jgi:hypothetical protein
MQLSNRLICLLLGFTVIIYTDGNLKADVRVLKYDLNFHFVCTKLDDTKIEYPMENFLRRLKFKVLNQARLQHAYGVFLDNVHIIAVDAKHRIVELRSVELTQNRYEISLTSPPPTERASAIEQQLLAYVADELGCEARQILYRENGADVQDLYQKELSRVENLFREADQLEGKQNL